MFNKHMAKLYVFFITPTNNSMFNGAVPAIRTVMFWARCNISMYIFRSFNDSRYHLKLKVASRILSFYKKYMYTKVTTEQVAIITQNIQYLLIHLPAARPSYQSCTTPTV